MALEQTNGQWSAIRAEGYFHGRLDQTIAQVRAACFEHDLQTGNEAEYEIDRYLEKTGNKLTIAPMALQLYGVDRICEGEVGGLPYFLSLEYKIDWAASRTGNLFIETQIRERNGEITPGWLRKTVAQTLVFYLPYHQRLFLVDANELREWIFLNGRGLVHSRWVENVGGYAGRGLLLPIETARNLQTFIDVDMADGA